MVELIVLHTHYELFSDGIVRNWATLYGIL